jgi:antitoxin StbD
MNTVYSPYTASVSELKKNPSLLLEESRGEPVAILNHNRPTAYLVPASTYEHMLEQLEDQFWIQVIEERKKEKARAREVSLDDL